MEDRRHFDNGFISASQPRIIPFRWRFACVRLDSSCRHYSSRFLQSEDWQSCANGNYKPAAGIKAAGEHYYTLTAMLTKMSVSQPNTHSPCSRSDCPHCERSCARENVSVRDMPVLEKNVIKPGGSRSSTWAPPTSRKGGDIHLRMRNG